MEPDRSTDESLDPMNEPGQNPNSALRLTLAALILGLSVELLFDGHPLGISFPIWAVLCSATLLLMASREGTAPSRSELTLAAGVLFFSVMVYYRMESLTTFLNVILTLILLTFWVRSFHFGRWIDYRWLDFALTPILILVEAWRRPWSVARAVWYRFVGERSTRSSFIAILRGVFIAIPILVVLIGLLSSADLIFADYVVDALAWLDLERLTRFSRGVLIVVVSALFFLGALLTALRIKGDTRWLRRSEIRMPSFLGMIESMVVLICVDLVFTGFVAVQFTYLFGGQSNIVATGYTYAEYARRGFGELTAVAVLCLGLITLLSASTRREGARDRRWFNGFAALLVGFVGVILFSALKRLLMYENAFGFTRLRTYTHIAILWMAVLCLAFLALLIAERLRRFAPIVALGIVGFSATLNLLNVDAFIIHRNAARFEASGKLDVQYIFRLSYDAVPELVDLAKLAPARVRAAILPQLACTRVMLDARTEGNSWQSSSRSLDRATSKLREVAEHLDDYTVDIEGWSWMVMGPTGEEECVGWVLWD
jgi:hypothetical protein